jgi:5-methylcytosine-specific restriction endonuclease McrA
MSNKRKKTDINRKSRFTVHDRDGYCCVYCGRSDRGIELAHFISRAQGGLGIPQNLISLCIDCHRSYDGSERSKMRAFLENYLRTAYNDWNESRLFYRKE